MEYLHQTHQEKQKESPRKIRNARGEITTDTTEIRRIIKEYCEQLYANKEDKIEKMDEFLETNNF